MNSIFSYKPLPDDHFRMLFISLINGKPVGMLKNIPFEKPPSYNALSYCWGADDLSETFICDGQRFAISPTLYGVLLQLSQGALGDSIWIDAICIDQSNIEEKESQVRRMSEIYANAVQVIVWLGSAATEFQSVGSSDNGQGELRDSNLEDIYLALDSIEVLTTQLKTIPDSIGLWNWPTNGIPDLDDRIWKSIGSIFARPWFYRLWVLQEIILAREIIILFGSKTISWETLVDITYEMRRVGLSYFARDESLSSGQKADGFVTIGFVNNLRRMFADNEMDFVDLLRLGREKNVTEAVDRIYGFLGLADDNLRRRIPLDYSVENRRDYWKVYEQFAKQYIPLDSKYSLLSMAMSAERPADLPSWCPNFHSRNPSTDDFSDNGYRAGYIHGGNRTSRVQISPNSNKIIIPGFRVDIVQEVTKMNWSLFDADPGHQDPAYTLKWEDSCLKLCRKTYNCSDDEVPAVHWRALIADFDKSSSPARADLERGYYLAKQNWKGKRDGDVEVLEENILVSKFEEALAGCPGRSFFNTEGGRVGRGPLDTKTGDVVCAFYSAGPVFVLRYKDGSNVAQLIGDAWLDGTMELSQMADQTRGKDEDFIIG